MNKQGLDPIRNISTLQPASVSVSDPRRAPGDLHGHARHLVATKASIVFFFLLYKFTIDYAYVTLVAPDYGYFGMNLDPSIEKGVSSALMVAGLGFLAPRDHNRASTYLSILLTTFIVIPALSYYWLAPGSDLYALTLFVSAAIFAGVPRLLKVKPLRKPEPKDEGVKDHATMTLWIIFVLYVLGALVVILARGGIDPRAFSFDDVYELRAENELGGALGYWYNWCTKAFFPFFLAYFICRTRDRVARTIGLSVLTIIQLLFYLSFGNKAFLFSVALVFIAYVGVRGKHFVSFILGGMTAGVILSGILLEYFGQSTLRFVFVVRTIFIPAQIQFEYFDWFQQHPFLYLSETSIGQLLGIERESLIRTSFAIGKQYPAATTDVNANTGLFSDGYANAGVAGMLLAGLILGLLLLAIEKFSGPDNYILAVTATSYGVYSMNDTPLTTSVVTGGLIVVIALLYVSHLADYRPASSTTSSAGENQPPGSLVNQSSRRA